MRVADLPFIIAEYNRVRLLLSQASLAGIGRRVGVDRAIRIGNGQTVSLISARSVLGLTVAALILSADGFRWNGRRRVKGSVCCRGAFVSATFIKVHSRVDLISSQLTGRAPKHSQVS